MVDREAILFSPQRHNAKCEKFPKYHKKSQRVSPGSDLGKGGRFVTSFKFAKGAHNLGNINRTSQPVTKIKKATR